MISTARPTLYALTTYGDSPVIVRTASGKHHAWYRHDGERRSIRPDKSHPIDILGGGICVASPSVRASGGRYVFVRGGLADLANLPKMRRSALLDVQKTRGIEQPPPVGDPATIGRRNDSVFRLALALAHAAESQADLLAQARKANAELCTPPNDDAELVRTVRKVWEYKLADRLMAPGSESAIILPAATIERLPAAGETDAIALLALLQKAHGGRRKTFAASPEAMQRERLIGSWDKRRYRHAARKLCDLGELVQVHSGGMGARDPALYRFAEGGRFAPQY